MDDFVNVSSYRYLPEDCKLAMHYLPLDLRDQTLVHKIFLEIYNDWPGSTGVDRVRCCARFIGERIEQYAKVWESSNIDTLDKLCKNRLVNYVNWFQTGYIPDLSDVHVFKTSDDFFEKFPSRKYRCACCNGITTDPTSCNSKIMTAGKECNWRSNGLFGDLGKGIKIMLLDNDKSILPITIFLPLELENNGTSN